MKIDYAYLNDKDFLQALDNVQHRLIYAKITVLNWLEQPIQEIQAKISDGSISVSGDSSVRRSGSMTVIMDDETQDVYNIDNIISINKKVTIEIGLKNTLKSEWEKYAGEDIIWFPQGVFVLTSVNITHDTSSYSMSIDFSDKMCLLDGSVAGTLGSAADLAAYEDSYVETYGSEVSESVSALTYLSIYDIIMEVVHHLGGEETTNIIIDDVDDYIKYGRKFYLDTNFLNRMKTIGGTATTALPVSLSVDYFNYYNSFSKMLSDEEGNIFDLVKDKDYEGVYRDADYEDAKEDDDDAILKEYNLLSENAIKLAQQIYDTINEDTIIYLHKESDEEYSFNLTQQTEDDIEVKFNEFMGYTYEVFCYSNSKTDLLTVAANDTVTSVLDKIKERLSNFEYFYDIEGKFHFQEIKNYLNTSKTTYDLDYLSSKKNYAVDRTRGDAVYVFDNSALISNYTNALQYEMIKNDYVVWGKHTDNETSYAHRYHLVIDDKPTLGEKYDNTICIKMNSSDIDNPYYIPKHAIELDKAPDNDTNKGKYGYYYTYHNKVYVYNSYIGWQNIFNYYIGDNKSGEYDDYVYALYYYDGSTKKYTNVGKKINEHPNPLALYREYETDSTGETYRYWNYVSGVISISDYFPDIISDKENVNTDYNVYTIKPRDYRAELLMQGLNNEINFSVPNDYYAELSAEWYKLYDIQLDAVDKDDNYITDTETSFREEVGKDPTNLDYYLEFIDSSNNADARISQFSVSNIGRRKYAESDDDLNCLFEPVPPDVILIDGGLAEDEQEEKKAYATSQGYPYCIVPTYFFYCLAGDSYNDTFNSVRNALYQYTSYNEAITMTLVPIYHLDVNTRITVKDKIAGIDGDYMINSFEIPFEAGGTMNFNCTKCLNKI